jgi:hypothetical protein
MRFAHKTAHVGRPSRILATALTVAGLMLVLQSSPASAYTGVFCNDVFLWVAPTTPYECVSSYTTDFRRTIGHSVSDWTEVGEDNQNGGQNLFGYCETAGCTANTGYEPSDIDGYSSIQSLEGQPYGGDYYYGYQYV